MHIYLIGTGPGNPDLLTVQAKRAIEASTLLVGDKRMLEPFEGRGKNWSGPIGAMKSAAWRRRGRRRTGPWLSWYQAMSAFSAWQPY